MQILKQKTFPLLSLAIVLLSWPGELVAQSSSKALIVGISKYSQLSKESQLQYADDDAMEFYDFLRSKSAGDFDSANVRLLLNEKATAAAIYGGLDWLIDEVKEGDRVIIYFSGHGDIETKTVRQRGFLLAHDSPKAGYKVGGTVDITSLQDYLETLVTENKAKVILITDACRSGKLAGGANGATQTSAALSEQWSKMTKILSSQAGELSGESKEWGNGHGVFTYNLINGLWGMADTNKDGLVSLSELNIYLSQEVPKATGESQHPVVSGDLRSTMSKTDPVMVTAITARMAGKSEGQIQVAANKGSLVAMDTATERLYRRFNAAISKNELIEPAKKNAYYYYKLLNSKEEKSKALINDLRRTLVAKLEDDAQTVLNKYMEQQMLAQKNFDLAKQELDTAILLIAADHPRYNAMLSRKLFLEANILGCTCSNGDVAPEEAAKSLALLRQAVRLEPDAAFLYNSMGSAFFYEKKYDSAFRNYSKSMALAPTWSYPVTNLGTNYKAQKKYDKALAAYSMSVKLAPTDIHAYNLIGNHYFDMKNYDEALKNYMKVLALDSGDFIYTNIGAIYFAKKDYVTAMKYHDRLMELNPFAGYDQGLFYYEGKQYDAATKYYKAFLKSLLWEHYENMDQYLGKDGTVREADVNPISYDLSTVYDQLSIMAEKKGNLALSYFYKGCMYFWKNNNNPKSHEWFGKSLAAGLKLKPDAYAEIELGAMKKIHDDLIGPFKDYDSWEDVLKQITGGQ